MVTSIEGEVFPDLATHPGELLSEELEARELTVDGFAASIGRPSPLVHDIVTGRAAITADFAVDIERVLDIPARLWLNLQVRYDLTLAYQAAEKRHRLAI